VRRILFVDDQQEVLNSHSQSLKKYRGKVETMFSLGGDAALEMARDASIDVVVADMHMPGMDGPMLLRKIKEEHPGIVRLMLCPQYETDAIFAALPTAHQVLAKPLDADILVNIVERTCRLRELLTDSLRKKIGAVDQLPSIPSVYLELTRAMSDPNVSNLKIARIVEKDPPMAAKTLQLVNSACFGMLKQVTSLDNAIAYLGMDLIKSLSLTVHIFAALEGLAVRSHFSFDAEQQHSLITAKVAKRLVSGRRQAQNAFTAALLHDIGKLVLAVCIPEKFTKVQLACSTTGRPSHEIEAEMLGVTHAEVGAYLLGLWGLPYPIVEAVAYHHNPSAALERNFDIPTAVAVANALVEEIVRNRPPAIAEHLQSLGVIDKLHGWTAIAREELQRVTPENVTIQ
jgi:putative nucleotidyltransferase with HDIG domain